MAMMNRERLVVGFFREKRDIETFHFKAPNYKQAYHEIIDQLSEKGVYVAILMGQSSYRGNGKFAKHWVQVSSGGQYEFEKRGEIIVDALYVKDYFDAEDDLLQINTLAFRKLCSDKHAAYELLDDFHPNSQIITSNEELATAFLNLPGDTIAVKTLTGNSGTGVYVGKKQTFETSRYKFNFPWQVQEYVETKGGIPGIADGRHDLRVVIANGEAVISTLRTPPEGGLKSNVGYGGKTRLVAVEDIPTDLLGLCKKIDERLAPLGEERFYSADFGLTAHGWRLFEINAMPGTIDRARGEQALYYQDKLTDFLKNAAGVGQKKLERKTS